MTSLVSDTNAILQILGNGDLKFLQSDALGYKFNNSASSTDAGMHLVMVSPYYTTSF